MDPDGTFYVQLVSQEDALADLSDQLAAALEAHEGSMSDIEVGQNLCAKFSEDELWYRAVVEACQDDGKFLVRFVDYGNTDILGADRLAPTPEAHVLSTTPKFASSCRLNGLAVSLTEEQADHLRDLVTDQVTHVKFVSKEGDIHQVNVTFNGKKM